MVNGQHGQSALQLAVAACSSDENLILAAVTIMYKKSHAAKILVHLDLGLSGPLVELLVEVRRLLDKDSILVLDGLIQNPLIVILILVRIMELGQIGHHVQPLAESEL